MNTPWSYNGNGSAAMPPQGDHDPYNLKTIPSCCKNEEEFQEIVSSHYKYISELMDNQLKESTREKELTASDKIAHALALTLTRSLCEFVGRNLETSETYDMLRGVGKGLNTLSGIAAIEIGNGEDGLVLCSLQISASFAESAAKRALDMKWKEVKRKETLAGFAELLKKLGKDM